MMYSVITVLRALALREGSEKIWKEYTKFDSHLAERMPTPIYSKVCKLMSVWLWNFKDLLGPKMQDFFPRINMLEGFFF